MERVDAATRTIVSDSGTGFSAEAIMNRGSSGGGLLNMQHHLDLMECRLQVKSQPGGKGTQVVIEISSDK
jgi:signal transduction histidine kinase